MTTFDNIVAKGEIAHHEPQNFSILFDYYTFFYGDFPCFDLNVFKVVCYTFAVCGKGLKNIKYAHNLELSYSIQSMIYQVNLSHRK